MNNAGIEITSSREMDLATVFDETCLRCRIDMNDRKHSLDAQSGFYDPSATANGVSFLCISLID